jgi:hypothetical protein
MERYVLRVLGNVNRSKNEGFKGLMPGLLFDSERK